MSAFATDRSKFARQDAGFDKSALSKFNQDLDGQSNFIVLGNSKLNSDQDQKSEDAVSKPQTADLVD